MPRLSNGPTLSQADASQLSLEAHELAEGFSGLVHRITEGYPDIAISTSAGTDLALALSTCRTLLSGMETNLDNDTVTF